MKTKAFVFILLCCAASLGAKVKLPALVGDNMVLQQQTEARLWGTALPGTEVRVTASWNGRTVVGRTNDDGNWLVTVTTPEAGYTPYEITFDDGEPLTVKNVLIGEVWLGSGQSNMEMPLKGFPGCCIMNSARDIVEASSSKGVRMFTVPKKQTYESQTDCGGSWQLSSMESAPEFSASAYHFAVSLSHALQIPVGIICSAYGGSKVESWMSREQLEAYPDVSLNRDTIEAFTPGYHRPMLMYNAMLKPLQHYTIKGFLWYQGESNVPYYTTYARRLADMVKLWRKEWGLGELPFYFVEIAPFAYAGKQKGKAAYLREAQFEAQALIPNSAMISTNDLVEPYEIYNIHPRNKTQVGQRLSYLALNLTYGFKQIDCFGPQYKALKIEGSRALVSFNHVKMGLCRNYDIQGFEIAGEDRVFYPAEKVEVRQRNSVWVSSNKVPRPVAVRYCFQDFEVGTMIGGNELPLVPFRTDNW